MIMLIFIKNDQVLQHEERINNVKLGQIFFKIKMLQKTKIIQFIIKDLFLISNSLKILFNMDDFLARKIGLRMAWKVSEYLPFCQTGPLVQNVLLSLFERNKKSMPYNNIWLKILS